MSEVYPVNGLIFAPFCKVHGEFVHRMTLIFPLQLEISHTQCSVECTRLSNPTVHGTSMTMLYMPSGIGHNVE